MRGEYRIDGSVVHDLLELPPRARRIPCVRAVRNATLRTTSACAENTSPTRPRRFAHRNYLRVRGEYINHDPYYTLFPELPPRARRILDNTLLEATQNGTTSACAENTRQAEPRAAHHRNYLRVRGEYQCNLCKNRDRRGTTSACAENTPSRPG